ncbi:tetraspanin-10 [Discoglossus pictus]
MGGKCITFFQKLSLFFKKRSDEPDESSRLLPKGEDCQEDAYDALQCHIQSNKTGIDDFQAPAPEAYPPYHPDVLITFIKYLMFFFNFVFSVLGLAILGIGFWGLLDKQSLMSDQISHLGTDPMLSFVLVGLVVSVLSISGCVGFLRENAFLLKLFSVGISTIMFIQLVSAIIILSFRKQIGDTVQSSLMVAVTRYQDDSDLRFIMDELQLGMECCGVQSYQDWDSSLYFNCSSPGILACGVPYSCCIDPLENGTVPNSQCGFGALQMAKTMAGSLIYLGGCVPQLALWLQSRSGDITAGFLFVITAEVICVLCARRVLGEIELIKSRW